MKKPGRFIVVDDDPINNALCKYALSMCFENVEIKLFTEPAMAIQSIQDEYGQPDINIPTVLFLDINMPDLSGWDFMNIFNEFNDAIKKQFTIFILSSSVNPTDKEKAASNQYISKFISKPLGITTIEQIFTAKLI